MPALVRNWKLVKFNSTSLRTPEYIWITLRKLLDDVGLELGPWNMSCASCGTYAEKRATHGEERARSKAEKGGRCASDVPQAILPEKHGL